MITNPFSRKPKSPIDQVLDVVSSVRADAAETASTIRDAAAKAADVLGDPPVPGGRKLPVLGLFAAAGIGVALAIRARAAKPSAESLPPLSPAVTGAQPPSPAVATAAKTTSSTLPQADPKPASEVGPEQPKEPKAETPESEAASG